MKLGGCLLVYALLLIAGKRKGGSQLSGSVKVNSLIPFFSKTAMKYLLVILSFLMLLACAPQAQKEQSQREAQAPLELDYQYLGKAVEKQHTHVWGSSPVIGKEGKTHLYVAEWPMPTNKEERFSGWYKHCQIGHYVGDSPEGPFEFVRIAVEDQDGVFNAPHNPTIQYLDGKYVLCFIVNENDHKPSQRIIMLVADELDDNWRPAAGAQADGTMLTLPRDSSYWNVTADRGVSNPSLVKFKDSYMLYFKSVIPHPSGERHKRNYGYGVSVSKNLEGPYEMHPERVTAEDIQLEDAYAFVMNDKVHMLSRDFRGTLGSNGGGLLWTSDDGFSFTRESTLRAFEGLDEYLGREALSTYFVYRGNREGHLERPQVLMENGKPAYLYVATGINARADYGSGSHVFKVIIGDK